MNIHFSLLYFSVFQYTTFQERKHFTTQGSITCGIQRSITGHVVSLYYHWYYAFSKRAF